MSAAGAAFVAQPVRKARAAARVDYPSNRLANFADLTINVPLDITYPDTESPGVILELGQAVEGGGRTRW